MDILYRPSAPGHPAVDDPELIELERLAAGDPRAFERIMRRYNGRLYRAVRSLLRDEAEAEEAVQDAYWKAYTHLGQFDRRARFSTWLTRIAINEALMRLRRNKRRAEFIQADMDKDIDAVSNAPAPPTDDPAVQASRSELRRQIEQAIDRLPAVYRTVFVLRALEDIPANEVARTLGIPEATVRTRYFRARGLMRAALGRDVERGQADAFSFAGARCDRIVAGVLARLAQANGKANDGEH